MKVPSFMLKKLYVDGSLSSTGDGFEFKLKNTLATATIVEPPELYIDGDHVDVDAITFDVDGEVIEGASISDDDSFKLTKGMEVAIAASEPAISDGAHKLRIKVSTDEWDTLDFEVEDSA